MWTFGSSRQTKHSQLLSIEILLKKVRSRKCDPLGPDDRLNLHNNMLIEILLKKVRRKKCDPLGPDDNLHHFISINRNFAQKSATQKVWPFGSSWQSKPSTLLLKEIFLKKVRRRKCDLWFDNYSSLPNKRSAIFINFCRNLMRYFYFTSATFIYFQKFWMRNFY